VNGVSVDAQDSDAVLSKKERRRRSEAAILAAARKLFAEHGYDRTSIRAVAGMAGIDPALVMQNFGSKEELFAAAVRWDVPIDELVAADLDQLPRAALKHVLDTFENAETRSATEALLRSCLTHPAAQVILRDQVMRDALARLAAAIGGPDAELRAAMVNALTLGLTISRYLLEVPAAAAADAADLERVLTPALRALIDPR
jgi:AcrR family transcriptional regulator